MNPTRYTGHAAHDVPALDALTRRFTEAGLPVERVAVLQPEPSDAAQPQATPAFAAYCPTLRKAKCTQCRQVFETSRRRPARFCSSQCRARFRTAVRQVRTSASRAKTCTECGEPFTAQRADAVTCSERCRHRRNYLRQRDDASW